MVMHLSLKVIDHNRFYWILVVKNKFILKIDVAKAMINPPGNNNTVIQMNMGNFNY